MHFQISSHGIILPQVNLAHICNVSPFLSSLMKSDVQESNSDSVSLLNQDKLFLVHLILSTNAVLIKLYCLSAAEGSRAHQGQGESKWTYQKLLRPEFSRHLFKDLLIFPQCMVVIVWLFLQFCHINQRPSFS